MEEGILKGRQEGIVEVALRMLEKGMSVEDICSITKLSRRSLIRVFEHENFSAISLVERRFSRYFCLSTFSEMNADVV